MGKSLADKIAEMVAKSGAKDYDIEDDEAVFEHNEHDDSNAESSDGEDSGLEKEHYVAVGRSKLRQQQEPVALKNEKYNGVKGVRKALYDSEDEDEEEEEQDEEEQDEEENSDGSDAVSMPSDSDEVESASEQSQEDEDAQSEDQSEEGEFVEDDEGTKVKREKMAQLVQKEVNQAMNKLSESIQRDALKAYAVLGQSKFFDNIIDTRIKLQKALNAANQLPLSKETWKSQLDEENTALLAESQKLLKKVMNQCIALRAEFQNKDQINQPEYKYDSSKKRTLDQYCKESENLDSQLKTYRSAILNRWSVKIASTSGKAALNSSKFKAVNQPADVQVENQLADLPRLLKRTRMNRRQITPLGFEKDFEAGKLTHMGPVDEAGSDAEDENDLDIPKNYDPRRKENSVFDTSELPYIFDDEDFYRVLLNDLVDKKIANAQQGSGPHIAITSRSQDKLKKNVDTKASKGRKLNFAIQESITNYEAPVNGGYKWSDEQIDEFFAGLLGQRINFDENVSEQQSGDEESETIRNDDIQIFG
ncbi:HBR313Wp [Eremothecium sinecaudum]|uniref:Protein BFR2 n=1 Tax=Eremothecium sinecaudum TaxID=45286 RepID=A0A120K1B6_9SACH|nr:HBR313Wp [Eremothecium sinecaudum]AMD19214.1 HBR313Wp [Eremothecium sinecaudum]